MLRDLPPSEYKVIMEQHFWKRVSEARKESGDLADDEVPYSFGQLFGVNRY